MNVQLFIEKHPVPNRYERRKKTTKITTRILEDIKFLSRMGYPISLICEEFNLSYTYTRKMVKANDLQKML